MPSLRLFILSSGRAAIATVALAGCATTLTSGGKAVRVVVAASLTLVTLTTGYLAARRVLKIDPARLLHSG